MSREARRHKNAEELYNETIARPLGWITSEAKITRRAVVHFKRSAATKVEQMDLVGRDTLRKHIRDVMSCYPSMQVVKIVRFWRVRTEVGYGETWMSLYMAQACRDGYNYHYARYLMTQGTQAEGI